MVSLPAVYIIFTLLNAFRRGISRQDIWREFRRQGIAMRPRLSFWLALCVQAHLLEDIDAPRVTPQQCGVTRFAPQWLAMPPDAQAFHLLEAWQNAPRNKGERRFRRKLLWKLQWDKPLTHKDLRAINGLQALGLWHDAQLTAWGKLLIKGEGSFPTPLPAQAWQIEEDHLVVPIPHTLQSTAEVCGTIPHTLQSTAEVCGAIPQQTDLLWDLETYLRPSAPGRYPLTGQALMVAVNQGNRDSLIALLERGLKGALPSEVRACILEQPTLQILEGIVIEFSHPADLEAARRNPNLRRCFERVLSPRHAFLAAKDAPGVLRLLARRGVRLSSPQDQPATKRKRTHFYCTPTPKPRGKAVPMLQLLEKHLELGQAVDILYRAPGYQAEKRRITPMLIEKRGEYTYVSAYCQTRRANRTFRLDRMEIPGTYQS